MITSDSLNVGKWVNVSTPKNKVKHQKYFELRLKGDTKKVVGYAFIGKNYCYVKAYLITEIVASFDRLHKNAIPAIWSELMNKQLSSIFKK